MTVLYLYKPEEDMNIKELRNLLNLTQVAFSNKYDIPLRTIQNWEYCKSNCPDYISHLLKRAVKDDYEQYVKKQQPIYQYTGMKIKDMRILLGLSQAAFGNKYEIPIRTIQDWESNRRICPSYVFLLLERAVKADHIQRPEDY